MRLTDKKIGVLMGGVSAEREVSLRSGTAVFNALKALGYDVVSMDVSSKSICEDIRKEHVDAAFIVLHGGWGEDGSVQGLLDVIGIRYTGSNVLASALAMDKEASKKIFLYHNIPVPPFMVVTRKAVSRQLSAIGYEMPWVIKPVCEGSSVGVSIVKDKERLSSAIEQAFSHDERVIIEKYIEGKEVHIGILGERVLGGVEVRPSLEFYSYEAKYTAGLTEYILPPEIDDKTYEKAEKTAFAAHSALGCRGATRVDLRLDSAGNPYVLEVNTIPGMTETSLLPKIARNAGLDFPVLIEEILKEALERKKG
ncbi:MAG: D-alanine--D-alanine ligase [Nitrospirae bacterium]|nr:D-alanine--D-alanine ligase [Nitrospirota bacterium]